MASTPNLSPTHHTATVTISYCLFAPDDSFLSIKSKREGLVKLTDQMNYVATIIEDDCMYQIRRFGIIPDEQGKALANLEAWITFPPDNRGERNLYVNKNPHDQYRFACVADLFTQQELKNSPSPIVFAVVYGEIVSASDPRATVDRTQFFELRHGLPTGEYRRAGTLPSPPRQPETFTTQHSEVTSAVLISTDGRRAREVPCIDVDGLLIGPLCVVTSMDIADAAFQLAMAQAETEQDDQRMPQLPTFTFRGYRYPPVADRATLSATQNIDLVIRIVNGLAQFDALLFPLPAYISIPSGSNNHEARIINSLKAECRSDTISHHSGFRPENSPNRLFDQDREKKWHIELWVLPQKHEKKMFRFKNDNLLTFLDKAMVQSGNVKLYMEAHVVRNKPTDFSDYGRHLDDLEPEEE